jgi:hypothetical protein
MDFSQSFISFLQKRGFTSVAKAIGTVNLTAAALLDTSYAASIRFRANAKIDLVQAKRYAENVETVLDFQKSLNRSRGYHEGLASSSINQILASPLHSRNTNLEMLAVLISYLPHTQLAELLSDHFTDNYRLSY